MNKDKKIKITYIIFIIIITLWNISLFGQDDIKKISQSSNLNRGAADMDIGRLVVRGIDNYGMQGNENHQSISHGEWGTLRWVCPIIGIPPQAWANNIIHEDSGTVDRSNFYNCIESFSQRLSGKGADYSDWEARDNAATQLMGEATIWEFGGSTLLATSTAPLSWPEGYFDKDPHSQTFRQFISTEGERYWPGYRSLDLDPNSPTYGKPKNDEFISDRDIYFIMNDKYNGIRSGDDLSVGYPVGFEVEVYVYGYSSQVYEDIVFYNYNLIYKDWFDDLFYQHYDGNIDSVYIGFYLDPDFPGYYYEPSNLSGSYIGASTPWAEDDYGYLDTDRNMFVMFDKDGYENTQITAPGRPYVAAPVSSYSIAFLETPTYNGQQVDLTSFHFFDQDDKGIGSLVIGEEYEKALYAMMSGQPNLLDQVQREKFFHGSNPHFDDLTLMREFQEPGGVQSHLDIQFLIGCGPFSIAPGDTLPIIICLIGGDDNPGPLDAHGFPTNNYEVRFADVLDNFELAKSLYENDFIISAVDHDNQDLIVENYHLFQNYPNPFNPSTTIIFNIPKESNVNIIIYDIEGKIVNELTNKTYSYGNHIITWNGKNANGYSVTSGLYFYSIVAGDFFQTKKMLLLR